MRTLIWTYIVRKMHPGHFGAFRTLWHSSTVLLLEDRFSSQFSQLLMFVLIIINDNRYTFGKQLESQRVQTYLLTCAPNEDSDQPAHSRSLIRVFIVRMKKLCVLVLPNCAHAVKIRMRRLI